MTKFTVTINFDDGEEIEKQFTFPSLNDLEIFLDHEFPDATSFVIAFSRLKA